MSRFECSFGNFAHRDPTPCAGLRRNIRLVSVCHLLTCLVINIGIFIPARASDDCINFKVTPRVNISAPEWQMQVIQPLRPMDVLHGNVVASFTERYDIGVDVESIEDGFCVVLRQIDASIGYTDFTVQIDSRHIPDSCAYNAAMDHENLHIRAHLAVIDDAEKNIHASINDAANSVMPIFVKKQSDAEDALDLINRTVQNHPSIILMKQKLKAEEEIRNKKIDLREDSSRINKCLGKNNSI